MHLKSPACMRCAQNTMNIDTYIYILKIHYSKTTVPLIFLKISPLPLSHILSPFLLPISKAFLDVSSFVVVDASMS